MSLNKDLINIRKEIESTKNKIWKLEKSMEELQGPAVQHPENIRFDLNQAIDALKPFIKATNESKSIKLKDLLESVQIFGIEYMPDKNSRTWKKTALTKSSSNPDNTKNMVKAIKKDAESLKKQEGWFKIRITVDGKPVNESILHLLEQDGKLLVYKGFKRKIVPERSLRFGTLYKVVLISKSTGQEKTWAVNQALNMTRYNSEKEAIEAAKKQIDKLDKQK